MLCPDGELRGGHGGRPGPCGPGLGRAGPRRRPAGLELRPNVFLAPWLRGATALLHDARFDAAERLEILVRERVSVLCMAPTEYRVIAARTTLPPLPDCRGLVPAGEALNPEVLRAWHAATGLTIRDGHGQTETGQITGVPPGGEVRPGSMGRPLPGDVIISAGYRIGPLEVESALVAHPAVAAAAAVAAPDPERGSVARAVVVLRDGHEPTDALARELQDHVKGRTAPYTYPRIVEFADDLPKTASGKVRRALLREDGTGGRGAGAPRGPEAAAGEERPPGAHPAEPTTTVDGARA